jgi:hypothetical protein
MSYEFWFARLWPQWDRTLRNLGFTVSGGRARGRHCRLGLETLECRATPSTINLTTAADDTLYQDATGNLSNGAGQHFYVGDNNQSTNNMRRGAIRFDLSAIPAGSTVTSVTLALHMSNSPTVTAQDIVLHRALQNWGEGSSAASGGGSGTGSGEGMGTQAQPGDVTWRYRFFNTQSWTNLGGDFAATASATTPVSGVGNYQWTGPGALADVQQWVNDPTADFGWILIGNETTTGTVKQFDTKENTTAANRPVLTVEYTTATPKPTTHFQVAAPAAAKVGSAIAFTVTALDEANNPTANYAGTVHFFNTDGAALLPADATLTNGTGVFSATFSAPGIHTIAAADTVSAGIFGTSSLIAVTTTATQLAVSAPAAVTAGAPFIVTVMALDAGGHTATDYSGTVQLTSTDNQAMLPASAPLVNGVGTFLVTLKTVAADRWTIKAQDIALASVGGTSAAITVHAAPANYFSVTAPANATTGNATDITVTAYDPYGNVATGYTGTVKLTSTDPAALNLGTYTFISGTGQDNGVHTFSVMLKTAGSQTITASDATSINPTVTGTSSPITTRGLVVTDFTPTATGFTVHFSESFVVGDVNLYGGSQASPLQDVTLVGASNGPVNGSFVVNPSGTSATFKASSIFLATFFQSSVLPDDSWTVVLVSGTGTGATAHGFFDSLNSPLDGGSNAGHANYTTSFTTANSSKEALSIPDFARGPDSANTIKVPNDFAKGIPVMLANVPAASGVTDVIFTLTYNPTLLTPTGAGTGDSSGTGSTFTMGAPVSVDATHSTVTFTWHNGTAQSGTVVLGDILANVPNSAVNEYKGKEILALSDIKVNGADFTGVTADGLHMNTYFGDVTGDGKISGLDVATAEAVAGGGSLGLPAFKLVDPAVVGDIAGDASIDATAVSDLASFTSSLPTPQIPAIPSSLTITLGGPDPTLSLGEPIRQGDKEKGRPGESSTSPSLLVSMSPGLVLSLPVILDDPHPVGSTGMEEAVLALTYDPKVLTVSSSDITLGSIPGLGSNWHLVSVVDQTTGQIGVDLYSTTAISATQSGSLVNIAFHVVPGAAVPATAVQLVSTVTPNGRSFSTEVADDQGQYVLSPGKVLPAMPALYTKPAIVDDMINFVVGRVCDQLGVAH